MEDPLPMAHVVLEHHKGDLLAATKFVRRQIKAARCEILRGFWHEVREVLAQIESHAPHLLQESVSGA